MRTFSLSICLRREYTVLCKHQFWCFFAVFLGKVNIFSRGTMWNIDENTFNECETRPVAEQKKMAKYFADQNSCCFSPCHVDLREIRRNSLKVVSNISKNSKPSRCKHSFALEKREKKTSCKQQMKCVQKKCKLFGSSRSNILAVVSVRFCG